MPSGATRPFLSTVMGARMAWSRLIGKERDDVPACPEGEDDDGVTKPSSGHGAPDATKPERDNRHADESKH